MTLVYSASDCVTSDVGTWQHFSCSKEIWVFQIFLSKEDGQVRPVPETRLEFADVYCSSSVCERTRLELNGPNERHISVSLNSIISNHEPAIYCSYSLLVQTLIIAGLLFVHIQMDD